MLLIHKYPTMSQLSRQGIILLIEIYFNLYSSKGILYYKILCRSEFLYSLCLLENQDIRIKILFWKYEWKKWQKIWIYYMQKQLSLHAKFEITRKDFHPIDIKNRLTTRFLKEINSIINIFYVLNILFNFRR